jgi:guanine deaminase
MEGVLDREAFMNRAIEIAASAAEENGALPYGAVVVKDGEIVGEGLNRAMALHDPTSHGEVEAIRDACRRLGTTDLTGAEMYTSAEPCSMCVATMILANMERLVYAADWQDSTAFMVALAGDNATLKRRYTTVELRQQVSLPPKDRDMASERMGVDAANAMLRDYVKARKS